MGQRARTAPPPATPTTLASTSQLCAFMASSASIPAATGEEKSGAGKVARKVTGAVVTVLAAALAITVIAKSGDCEGEVSIETGVKKSGGNPIANAFKGFFSWGRGLYP